MGVGFLASLALKLSPVGRGLKAVGGFFGRILIKQFRIRVWMLLVIAVAAWFWHKGKVEEADLNGYNRAVVEGELLNRSTNTKTLTITKVIREKADANAIAINTTADRERLLGPGKASAKCPTLTGSAGGPEPAAGTSLPTGDSVPSGDRFADASIVPWGWLVSHAQTCDLDRNEALAWRTWHKELTEAWPKPAK